MIRLAKRRVALVVEDEPFVRMLAVDMLEDLGFEVHEVWNGELALDKLAQHPEISVLFTDVKMPGIDGVTLAKRASELYPGLHIVLTSGYMPGSDEIGFPFVSKPWNPNVLKSKLSS